MKLSIRSIGVFVGFSLGIAALAIGVGLWFFLSHRNTVAVSPQLAEIEFSELRARFSNQEPLIEMSRREASETPAVSHGVAPLRSFHTIIFDTRGGHRIGPH